MSVLLIAIVLVFLTIVFAMKRKNMMVAKKTGEESRPGPSVPQETSPENDPTVLVAEPIPQEIPAEPLGSVGSSLRNLFRG